jgi:putative sigma-54 modulation protein
MTIKILVNASDIELTPHVKLYVENKLSKVNRIINNVDEIRVDLKYNHSVRNPADKHVAQLTLRSKNLLLRSEERSNEIYASIDAALDKLYRQIEKYKGKRLHIRGGNGINDIHEAETALADEERESENIVRRKKFILEPMNEKEAMEQMQMLGHEEFFLFQNIKNGGVNVIYKRRDGTYGLLEPEIR